MDYLEDYIGENPSAKTQGDTKVPRKLNLQFFAEDIGGKKATAKSTFWDRIHKDKNGVAFDTPISLKQALEKLDASGLRSGQENLYISQLNDVLDGIQNNYNWEMAKSFVYFDGPNQYLVEGHHTTVAFKMLQKKPAPNMNFGTTMLPSVTDYYWTKKWYQFWRKTIKIKN